MKMRSNAFFLKLCCKTFNHFLYESFEQSCWQCYFSAISTLLNKSLIFHCTVFYGSEKRTNPIGCYSYTSVASLSIAQGANEVSDVHKPNEERAQRVTFFSFILKEGV